MDIVERLRLLERRLEDEGRYVDANICWEALKEIDILTARIRLMTQIMALREKIGGLVEKTKTGLDTQ